MPTSHTARLVEEGQSFTDFVWTCARGMGALLPMSDLPPDTPIPESFTPDTDDLHARLRDAQARMNRLEGMSYLDKMLGANEANERAVATFSERRARERRIAMRVVEMIALVEAWEPPTGDHVGFKTYMLDQLDVTLRRDGLSEWGVAPPEPLDPEEWHEAQVSRTAEEIRLIEERIKREESRTAERNAWVAALRGSL